MGLFCNFSQTLGLAWGGPTMIMGFMHLATGDKRAMIKVLVGAAAVTAGLVTPGEYICVNQWLPVC
jgi:hypothetical protein